MARPETKFTCRQCGKCCEELGNELTLSAVEVRNWKAHEELVRSNFGYYHLADFMHVFTDLGSADLWFHPVTGEELFRCPFLRKKNTKYECLIHGTGLKPDVCKEFPVDTDTGELWNESCPEVRKLAEFKRRHHEKARNS